MESELRKRLESRSSTDADVVEALKHIDLLQGTVDELHRQRDEAVQKCQQDLAAMKRQHQLDLLAEQERVDQLEFSAKMAARRAAI